MESLQDLLQFILRNEYSVVFSNLGRYPKILLDALEALPQLQISVQSNIILFPAPKEELDHRVRIVSSSLDPCDLLVVVEPSPQQKVVKPLQAKRIVVFTSQLNFQFDPATIWTPITYIHASNLQLLVDHTRRLLSIQDDAVQTNDVKNITLDVVHKLVVAGRTFDSVPHNDTYVVVDLIRCTSGFEMFMTFLNSFDFMLENIDKIRGWLICYAHKNGRLAFEQFIQNCLDKLFCRNTEYGNVTKLQHLLAMVPFYQSGCIDRNFNVSTQSFGNVRYVAVKSAIEACQAAMRYDLEHWAGPMYIIKE